MQELDRSRLTQLDDLISKAARIVVTAHTHPDGDALGSTLAMMHYLREIRGKEVDVILPDGYPDFLAFLPSSEKVLIASERYSEASGMIASADMLICLDISGFSRTGCLSQALSDSGAVKVLIDHHLNPDEAAFDLVFSTPEISSASELLYWILTSFPGVESASGLPHASLVALMTGMTTDTNNFANSVFPSTLAMASALLQVGVDRNAVLAELYNSYRENRVRAMGVFLDSLLTITPDGVAYMVADKALLRRLDLMDGETEGFVNIPLSIAKVKMSLLLKEDDGFFRVSIRSKKGWSANNLAVSCFHGGGHECAAGGRLLFPEDIATPADAAAYIEEHAARFMHETSVLKTDNR